MARHVDATCKDWFWAVEECTYHGVGFEGVQTIREGGEQSGLRKEEEQGRLGLPQGQRLGEAGPRAPPSLPWTLGWACFVDKF